MEDNDGEEDVGVAAHEAYPARFTFENHEYCEVDYTGGEGCAAANKASVGHSVKSGVRIILIRVKLCENLALCAQHTHNICLLRRGTMKSNVR